ncbi:MAG TPA: thioredoxin family protein [Dehalococcoidia bacterium]|nr:thioredoxin family protein [Dehalococcoidia bacterium]
MVPQVKVELLTVADCPSKAGAEAMIESVAGELGLDVSIEFHEVSDEGTGQRLRFAGSPTIRVQGVDIEPGWESSGDFAPRCRIYQTAAGLRGLPERDWLRSACEVALTGGATGEAAG